MSEIRVNRISSPTNTITIAGITTFSTTSSVVFSGGTTTQRPSTPVEGQVRYNNENNYMEYYNGVTWVSI